MSFTTPSLLPLFGSNFEGDFHGGIRTSSTWNIQGIRVQVEMHAKIRIDLAPFVKLRVQWKWLSKRLATAICK
jgi:hypothetical protein